MLGNFELVGSISISCSSRFFLGVVPDCGENGHVQAPKDERHRNPLHPTKGVSIEPNRQENGQEFARRGNQCGGHGGEPREGQENENLTQCDRGIQQGQAQQKCVGRGDFPHRRQPTEKGKLVGIEELLVVVPNQRHHGCQLPRHPAKRQEHSRGVEIRVEHGFRGGGRSHGALQYGLHHAQAAVQDQTCRQQEHASGIGR